MRHLLTAGALLLAVSANAAIPSSERAALVALYESTSGPSWNRSDGWLGAAGTECSWYGIECNEGGTHVDVLAVSDNGLDGTIPREIGNLSQLRSLQLFQNNLRGEIPDELSHLSELVSLYLTDNQLTGELPRTLGSLKKLEVLYLAGNQLTGELPTEIGGMTALREFSASYNGFSGPLPASLGNLLHLADLELSVNQFSGNIPRELGMLSKLERLGLADNQLSGAIPPELGDAAALRSLRLHYNQLSGTIPSSLGDLRTLEELDLTVNELTGSVPFALGGLASLRFLALTSNELAGPFPSALLQLTALEELYLGDNNFSGLLPANIGDLRNLQVLSLYANAFEGAIPASLTTIAPLRSLELQQNRFTGPVPPELANLSNLVWLDLAANQLSGGIPSQLATLSKLEVLSLYENSLVGTIPPELGQLSSLRLLLLGGNTLTGSVPDALRALTKLEQFNVNGNALSGPIPSWIGEWNALRDLFLGENRFSGGVPPSLATLGNLEYLDLGDNRLTGPLPDEFAQLASLDWASLSNNDFEGEIPTWIGALSNLTVLTMSGNRFSGPIPDAIGDLSKLNYLDVSFNALRGPIPASIMNLTSLYDGSSDFAHNALFSNDPAIDAFVNTKHYDGAYEATQTVKPEGVQVVSITDRNATLRWEPIAFDYFAGGYQVVASTTPGGPAAVVATTSSKALDSITIRNLQPSTRYYFTVTAITHPHAYQKNLVVSDATAPVAATTGARVLSPPDVVLSESPRGTVQIDGATVSEDSFTLTNFGDVPATLLLQRSDEFFQLSPTNFTIEPGASQVVRLIVAPMPAGTYYGYVAINGEGATDLIAYVVVLSATRPSGTVNAEPLVSRIELAGVPGSDSVGTVQFRNTGTAALTGIVVSDQPWVEVSPEPITIEAGQIGTAGFRIVRSRRPESSQGALTANLSLIYVNGNAAALRDVVVNATTGVSVSKVSIVDVTKPAVVAGSIPPLAPGETPFFVPGVKNDTRLRSDISITNMALAGSISDLKLYLSGATQTSVASLFPLGFGRSVNLENIVGSVYSATGGGTLQVRSGSSAALVTAAKMTAVGPDEGHAGVQPVFRGDRALAGGETLYLVGLAEGADLVFQETGGVDVTASVEFRNASGANVGALSATVTANGMLELSAAVPAGAVVAQITNPEGSSAALLAWARVRDASGDPWSVVDWSRQRGFARDEAVRIPLIDGSEQSSGGGFRRRAVRNAVGQRATDVYVFNPGAIEMRATLEVIAASGSVKTSSISVSPGRTLILRDVGAGVSSLTAHAVITPLRGTMAVSARSHDEAGGAEVAILAASSGLRLGQRERFSGLSDSTVTRTGYGLVESGGKPARVKVSIVIEDASPLVAIATSKVFDLAAGEQLFLAELVRSFAGDGRAALPSDLHNLTIEVEVVAGEGAVVPFVLETNLASTDSVLHVR